MPDNPKGCALLEDGTGGVDVIAGQRLLDILRPTPQILFLSACHSEFIFKRAKFDTDSAEAYERGQQIVANDPDVGDFSVLPDQTPPSEKLQLGAAGRDRVLESNERSGVQIPQPTLIADSLLTRRRAGDFIGRRRERWRILNAVSGKLLGEDWCALLERELDYYTPCS